MISIGTGYDNYHDVSGDYEAIAWGHLRAAPSYAEIAKRHVADYRRLFTRTPLDLGRTAAADQPTDARIERDDTVTGSDRTASAITQIGFSRGRRLFGAGQRLARAIDPVEQIEGVVSDGPQPNTRRWISRR